LTASWEDRVLRVHLLTEVPRATAELRKLERQVALLFGHTWTDHRQTHRIACITYHKYPQEAWPESEFRDTQLTLPGGEQVSLRLAERGSWIGSRREGLWVREIRKLTESGHQTSLISTAYGHD
jgi:hypothetical protein